MNYLEFVFLLEKMQAAAKDAHDKKLELGRSLRIAEEDDICNKHCIGGLVAQVDMKRLEVEWAKHTKARASYERHFEDPPYCWRMGDNVTLDDSGRCPECGWKDE